MRYPTLPLQWLYPESRSLFFQSSLNLNLKGFEVDYNLTHLQALRLTCKTSPQKSCLVSGSKCLCCCFISAVKLSLFRVIFDIRPVSVHCTGNNIATMNHSQWWNTYNYLKVGTELCMLQQKETSLWNRANGEIAAASNPDQGPNLSLLRRSKTFRWSKNSCKCSKLLFQSGAMLGSFGVL